MYNKETKSRFASLQRVDLDNERVSWGKGEISRRFSPAPSKSMSVIEGTKRRYGDEVDELRSMDIRSPSTSL